MCWAVARAASSRRGHLTWVLECRWTVAAWRAEGGTENVPRKHGEAAVQADRADGGRAAFRTRMARKQYAQT